ncbi:MAG: helix-hairpin-helix domain-containing protein [Solirubrobacterales bacterium]
MGSLSRSQLLVYGAVGVALLLVGARWIRSSDSSAAQGGVSYSSASGSSASSGDGSLAIDPNGGGDVVVDVAGEVGAPGVYRFPAGSRVTDALERAGGATRRADPESINLAARLADGQQIVMPARAKSPAGVAAGPAGADSAAATGPISLGTATIDELDTIEGIGPVTAQNIIDFRDQHGGVSSVDQLDQISGIGPATMDALRARLQP